MSNLADDRNALPETPPDSGAIPFGELGRAPELAPDTPLTREAVVHLRAAASEIDHGAATVQALLETVRTAIHPGVVGEDVTLSEDEAHDLARTLEAAREMMHEKVVRPVFARGRGERPHGGVRALDSDSETAVTLDRGELDALALDLARIGEAASMADFEYRKDQLRTGMRAAAQKVDDLIDRLYAKAGVTVDDCLLGPLHEEARRWRDDLLDEPSGNRAQKSDGAAVRRVAPGRLRRVRSELQDAREYLGEDADVELAREYVEKGLQRLWEAMASALPGSHDHIEPGQFGDDGLFRGYARCVACGTVEKLDGVEPKRRGPDKGLVREHIRGMAGTYLEATCPGCFTSLLAMDDGELAPVMGRRGW